MRLFVPAKPTALVRNIAAGVLMATLAPAVPAAMAAEFTMQLGVIPRNEPLHHYIERFAERIEEASEGRIVAEVFAGGELGSVQRMLENTQLGTQQMVVGPPAFARGMDRRYDVGDAPGLFQDLPHAFRAMQDPEFRDAFLGISDDLGLVGVGIWVYGPTAFATRQPVRSVDDLEGLRVRVLATEIETGAMRALGATGVPMDITEVVPAMQNRAIDGVRSNHVALMGINAQTAASYLSMTADGMIPIVAWVSQSFMDSLPDDLRQMVLDVAREVEEEMLPVVEAAQERALGAWRQAGVEVIEFSPEERDRLLEYSRTVATEVFGQSSDTAELFELLQDAAARTAE